MVVIVLCCAVLAYTMLCFAALRFPTTRGALLCLLSVPHLNQIAQVVWRQCIAVDSFPSHL